MSVKLFLIIIFSVVSCKAQENNQICSCDTEQDKQDNKELWLFLKKLSVDVSDDMKDLYAISPGNLYQFDCSHCDEKLRKKRKIMLETETVDVPEEAAKEVKEQTDEGAEEEADREKRFIHFHDWRCPKGYIRLAHYCVPGSEFQDYSEVESKEDEK